MKSEMLAHLVARHLRTKTTHGQVLGYSGLGREIIKLKY